MFNVFSMARGNLYLATDGTRTRDMSKAAAFATKADADKARVELNETSCAMHYVGHHVTRIA
jgi:hypothetical protein